MDRQAWQYGPLFDTTIDAPGSTTFLELSAGTSVADAALTLEALFAAEPTIERVTIVVDGAALGQSSRTHLRRISPRPGRYLGEADSATLPGAPTAYRLLRFRCPVCDAMSYRVHVDGPDDPQCPRGHGLMLEAE